MDDATLWKRQKFAEERGNVAEWRDRAFRDTWTRPFADRDFVSYFVYLSSHECDLVDDHCLSYDRGMC